ncbi:MAG TPA: hypothetical protein VNT77_08765 [Allosphingosinicella sp.]|nr:hypothetical protein [Allosphingosinicella sp.]
MHSNAPHEQPSHVSAEEGEVHLDGPGGLAAALTPDAAEETARRLMKAASQARRQLDGDEAL